MEATVNIEEIMKEIRREAEALKVEEPALFEDIAIPAPPAPSSSDQFNFSELESVINQANRLWEIPYGHVITGNPLKKLIARISRKAMKPTGVPMAHDITEFNAEVVRGLNGLLLYVRESRNTMEAQASKIGKLEEELASMKKEVKALRGKQG